MPCCALWAHGSRGMGVGPTAGALSSAVAAVRITPFAANIHLHSHALLPPRRTYTETLQTLVSSSKRSDKKGAPFLSPACHKPSAIREVTDSRNAHPIRSPASAAADSSRHAGASGCGKHQHVTLPLRARPRRPLALWRVRRPAPPTTPSPPIYHPADHAGGRANGGRAQVEPLAG
jgi:hypothetical protein